MEGKAKDMKEKKKAEVKEKKEHRKKKAKNGRKITKQLKGALKTTWAIYQA